MRRPRYSEGATGWFLCCIAFVLVCGSAAEDADSAHVNSESFFQPVSLALIEQSLLTTAREDFDGSSDAYQSAVNWLYRNHRGHSSGAKNAPHLACAKYSSAQKAFSSLENIFQPRYVRRLSLKHDHGSCFIVTAPPANAASVLANHLGEHELHSFGPFPSVLKLSPELLEHNMTANQGASREQLSTTHGKRTRMENVGGLNVELSPGVLPKHDIKARPFVDQLLSGLMDGSIDLHATNFWSDPSILERERGPVGAMRSREWTRAADVIHGLSAAEGGPTAGDVCGWGGISMHHSDDDILLLTGLDHLLPPGRGAGGSKGAESEELKVACFMGLVSYLASVPEVLRVAPLHRTKVLNAVSKAITQSATITDTPLTEAGLDGTGEIIQVVDSGADQDSCYFRDSDGENVEGGYYFEEVAVIETISATGFLPIFDNGSFPVDLDRRKIVQYISLIRPDVEGDEQPLGDYYTTERGRQFPWYSAEGFTTETPGGHGSHTAGSAAGSPLNSPVEIDTCSGDDELGCLGSCLNASYVETLTNNNVLNVDTMCPRFDCDGQGDDFDSCLTDDTVETLTAHGGVAPGAQLAIFDVSPDGVTVWAELALNGLWAPVDGMGCVVHSNSWGGDGDCAVDDSSVAFDRYMYENPEHLLIFAVGNDGLTDSSTCTVGSPAIGKNVLSVGATSAGESRWTVTNADGGIRTFAQVAADIDTVAVFSSYGPTTDNRIKPEVVAPGDGVLSVSSAGETGVSCRLEHQLGTSMATPIVAGSAAMIRQYFKDSSFYVTDLEARGLCNDTSSAFVCEEFDPSAATTKAMLVNSAHLMGGSSEPDGKRGFGRVYLEAGLPLSGAGDVGLFVVDSSTADIAGNAVDEYTFEIIDGDAGELRATLAWIDPAASTLSATQLVHDLDLTVTSPSGTTFTMWTSGEADADNVIERVIVSADDLAQDSVGTWTVTVSAKVLSTETQAYSLVVTGPFGDGVAFDTGSSAAPRRSEGGSRTSALLLSASVVLASALAGLLHL